LVSGSVSSVSSWAWLASIAIFPGTSDLSNSIEVVVPALAVVDILSNTVVVAIISKLTSWAELALVGLLVDNLVATAGWSNNDLNWSNTSISVCVNCISLWA
jgi:hypothetical protein